METLATRPTSRHSAKRKCRRCGERFTRRRLALRAADVEIPQLYCDDCSLALLLEDEAGRQQQIVEDLLTRAGGGRMTPWSLQTYPDDATGRRAKGIAAEWFSTLTFHDRDTDDRRHASGSNLLLFGPVGTGKTGLAWSLVRALCEERVDAMLVPFRHYLREIRTAIRERTPVDDRPHRVSVLALDDLGAERPTDFAREELATLVEHRTERGLPTIVTSNYDPAELIGRLGHDEPLIGRRIVSRLVQDATQFRLEGVDRRLGGLQMVA